MIVDDELDVREFAGNFFRKRGFNVQTAASGKEALRLVREDAPDLVLLDIRMDEMSGVEVLRELRQGGSPVKVVIVSGIEEEGVVKETAMLGATGFIHKPLILEELEKAVLREFVVNI